MIKDSINSPTQAALIVNNRYVIADFEKDKLGEGGIGVVYKATDTKEQKPVAIKILHSLMIHDEWIRDKFDKEAQAIIRINHKYVVLGKESGKLEDGRPYLVMEYIEGQSLRKLLERHSHGMDLVRSANIIKQFGEALTAIHSSGVYHRDLKPENIMVTNAQGTESIKVIDFGIATVKESPDEKTKTTLQLAGTPFYMAPEQMMDGNVSAKSDIYAMGVIAYEMATGRRPFHISKLTEISDYIKYSELQKKGANVRPKQLRQDLPEKADDLIMQALEFEPTKRPISAEIIGNAFYEAIYHSNESNKANPSNISTQATLIPTKVELLPEIPTRVESQPQLQNRKNLFIVATIVVFIILGVLGKTFFLSSNPSTLSTPSSPSKNENNQTTAINKENNNPTSKVDYVSKVNYFVELEEFREGKYQKPFAITGVSIVVHDKDRILFNVKAENTGYIYLLNESPKPLADGSPRYNILFPAEKELNQLQANQEIKLPNKDQAIGITGAKGVEKFWVVWSKDQLQDLESLRTLLNKEHGGVLQDSSKAIIIKEMLEKYSSDKFVKMLEDKKAKIMTSTSTENIVTVLVEIDHK